jgi:hypothetical protein
MHRQNTPPLRAEAPRRNRRDSSTLNASSLMKSGGSLRKKVEKKGGKNNPFNFQFFNQRMVHFHNMRGPRRVLVLSCRLRFPHRRAQTIASQAMMA